MDEDSNESSSCRREDDLVRLLALEKEKRLAAERDVEIEKQAILQLKLLLEKRRNEGNFDEGRLKKSTSTSSSFLNSSLPRIPSLDFSDTILQRLPVDLQTSLGVQSSSNNSTDAFSKLQLAVSVNDAKKLREILLDDAQTIVSYGIQLLNEAINNDSPSCVKILLELGCNPNQPGLDGLPLLIAAANNHTNCLKVLIDHGTDLNITNNDGYTALYLAIKNKHCESIDLLLKSGSELTSTTKVGDTLLHVAVTSNMPNILRTLLVEISLCIIDKDIVSSIVNKYNEDGLTPLHQAIKENKKECIEILSASPEVDSSIDLPTTDPAFEKYQELFIIKSYKVAIVTISTGRPRNTAIGNVRVLPHHRWDDVYWLVTGSLEQFTRSVNGRIDTHVYRSDDNDDEVVSPPQLNGKISDELLHLVQIDKFSLCQEIESVVKSRCKSLHALDLDRSDFTLKIGNYSGDDESSLSPYDALVEMEDDGKVLEINLELKNRMEWIEFVTLYPQTVLREHINVLLKNKCIIVHGPPGSDLNSIISHLFYCLKAVDTCTKFEKVHMPLHPDFHRQHLITSLYENDLLCHSNQDNNDEYDDDEYINRSFVLILEEIDKLQHYEALDELCMLLRHGESDEEVWLDISDHTHTVPPGKYKLRKNCYVLATRKLFMNINQSLPQSVMNECGHIWLTDCEEPMVGSLVRYLMRELIDYNKGDIPQKSDYVYLTVIWVWQFWLLYNHYMCQLNYYQLTIGPKVFFNCPVQTNSADSIYNWFIELWNFHIVPKLKETIMTPLPTMSKNTTHKSDTFKQIVFFLMYRLIYMTCPLPSEDAKIFILALHHNKDLSTYLSIKPGDDVAIKGMKNATKELSKPSRKASGKRASKKAVVINVTDTSAEAENEVTSNSLTEQKTSKTKRPKSAGLMFKNSTLRRSLFKGSRNSLYAVEEEKKKSQNNEKEKEKNINDLFDMLLTTSSQRMNEQRIDFPATPPHHVISTDSNIPDTSIKERLIIPAHSSSHSFSGDLNMTRSSTFVNDSPSTANNAFPHASHHPRVSNLIMDHNLTLPRRGRSISECNIFEASNTYNHDHDGLSAPTSEILLHAHEMSTNSDFLSSSAGSGAVIIEEETIDKDSSEDSPLLPQRKLKSYNSEQLLYSSTLGLFHSLPGSNYSSPNTNNSSSETNALHKHRSAALLGWQEEVEL